MQRLLSNIALIVVMLTAFGLQAQQSDLNVAMMQSTFMLQGRAVGGGTTEGTGFLLMRPLPGQNPKATTVSGKMVLVTAAHVFEGMAEDMAEEFFNSLGDVPGKKRVQVVRGLGSAEGLARALGDNPLTLLAYDELQAFVEKTRIQGSVLLSAVTSLYEKSDYDNYTKDQAISIRNAQLGLIGCATDETYQSMWTPEAVNIGLPNRLWLVGGVPQPKVLFPEAADNHKLDLIRERVQKQLARLPLQLKITPDAANELSDWYNNVPPTSQSKRLDTILRSLLPLIALITDKNDIDVEVAKIARRMMEYEFLIRQVADPVVASNKLAECEEKIRRALQNKGCRTDSQLKRDVHYERFGISIFGKAIMNLRSMAKEIETDKKSGKHCLTTSPV